MENDKWKMKSKSGYYGTAVCQELHFPFTIFHLSCFIDHFESGGGRRALELVIMFRFLRSQVARCGNWGRAGVAVSSADSSSAPAATIPPPFQAAGRAPGATPSGRALFRCPARRRDSRSPTALQGCK